MGTEVIRYTQMGKEDIRFGTGSFEVFLADGRKVILSEVDLGDILNDSSISSTFNPLVVATGSTTGRLLADRFAGMINVHDCEAVGDGVANDRGAFVQADGLSSGPITCLPGKTYRINSDLTISSNVLFNGGKLKPASGVTISLDGGVGDTYAQIFDLSLGGVVVIGLQQPIRPEWWGAKANDSGTDSASAVQATFTASSTASLQNPIELTGRYYCGTRIVVSSTHAFAVRGRGVETSALIFTAASSGLELIAAQSQTSGPWVVEGFGLYAQFAGCTGPSLTVGYTTVDSDQTAGAIISKVDTSYDPRNSNILLYYWLAGFELVNVRGGRIEHPFFYGHALNYDGNAILLTGDCTPGPRITTMRAYFWDKAVTKGELSSDLTEGTKIISPNFVAVNYGAYFDSSASAGGPGVQIYGGHISAKLGGAYLVGAQQFHIRDVLFYRRADATGDYQDIYTQDAVSFVVAGNIVGTDGVSGTETFLKIRNGSYGVVTGNVVQGAIGKRDVGVDVDSTSSQITIDKSNIWTGATTAIVNGMVSPQKNNIIDTRQSFTTTSGAGATTFGNITLNDATTYHIMATILAVTDDGVNRATYEVAGTFYRTGAGNATLQGTVTTIHSAESDAAWNATLDTNNLVVRHRVTGAAATNVKWYAETRIVALPEAAVV